MGRLAMLLLCALLVAYALAAPAENAWRRTRRPRQYINMLY